MAAWPDENKEDKLTNIVDSMRRRLQTSVRLKATADANRQACPNAEGRTEFQGEEPNVTRRPPLCGAGRATAGFVNLYFAPV